VRVHGVCHMQPVILRCILRYVSCANAVNGPSPGQNMFRDRTEVLLDRSGPVPGPGPALTLSISTASTMSGYTVKQST